MMEQSEIPLGDDGEDAQRGVGDAPVVYEQPLTERMRTFLRLEFLFVSIRQHLARNGEWDCRAIFRQLLDILTVVSRGDLKSEVLKEMERQRLLLAKLMSVDGVDTDKLSKVLLRLEELDAGMRVERGQLAAALREDEFIATVRHRAAIPGGTCRFDLPAFHHWLSRPAEQRIVDLQRWLSHLEPLRESLALMLTMIRESDVPSRQVAAGGTFQRDLDPNANILLVRIALPRELEAYPEVSASKHRFTLRFMRWSLAEERPRQVPEDQPFQLTICRL